MGGGGGGGCDARGAVSSSARFCRVVYYAPSLPWRRARAVSGCVAAGGSARAVRGSRVYGGGAAEFHPTPPCACGLGNFSPPHGRTAEAALALALGFGFARRGAGLCLIHHHPLSPPLRFRLSLFPLRVTPLGFLFSGCTPHERSRSHLAPAKSPGRFASAALPRRVAKQQFPRTGTSPNTMMMIN